MKIKICAALFLGLAAGLFADIYDVKYKCLKADADTPYILASFNISFNGTQGIALDALKIRYYYTKEGTAAEQFTCEAAACGKDNVVAEFKPDCVEIGFKEAAGELLTGKETGEIRIRIAKTDASNYNQSDDYSFAPALSFWADNTKIGLFQYQALAWGTPPRTPTPTPKPAKTPANTGQLWMVPASQKATVGSAVSVTLLCNSGNQTIAAYTFHISYPANLLSLYTASPGGSVEAGTHGMLNALNTATAGTLSVSGFDIAGKGPGEKLQLLKINFIADAAGTAGISVLVEALVDAAYANINIGSNQAATIIIEKEKGQGTTAGKQ